MSSIIETLLKYAEENPCDVPHVGDVVTQAREQSEFYIAYAYSPRETGTAYGGDHIVSRFGFTSGRLHRDPHQALCQPASKRFWGLHEMGNAEPTCPRCKELAARHGIKLDA